MDHILRGSLCFALFVTIQAAPVTTTTPDDCEDYGLSPLGAVDCSALLNQDNPLNNIYGAYKERMFWCNEDNYQLCCKTCQTVLNSTNAETTTENQPDSVNTHATSKVQIVTESDKTTPTLPNKMMYHVDDKISKKGPGYEIFVDMLRNRGGQGIPSIDIRIFPNKR